jgi:hypothetical protein
MDFVTDATIYIFGSVFLYITILPLIKKIKREDKKTTKKRKNKN